jgi:hypothetical protein
MGRPSRWPREKSMEAASQLRGILERETRGRVSVNSYIGQYVLLLNFPSDVVNALPRSEINLQEAAQLARLTNERLRCSPREAFSRRAEALRQHLAVQESQTCLRTRVKELLGESGTKAASSENMTQVVAHETSC